MKNLEIHRKAIRSARDLQDTRSELEKIYREIVAEDLENLDQSEKVPLQKVLEDIRGHLDLDG